QREREEAAVKAAERALEQVRAAVAYQQRAVEQDPGERERLALFCTLLHRPQALLLNEPKCGVDPPSRRRFWDLIYEMAEAGSTVIVSTHSMDEAEYCQRLALMHRGRVVALGAPGELRAQCAAGATINDVFTACIEREERQQP
ncbi:MAG: ABC transporter ATP-binding protein, partial [Bryobacteraceae bacterium]